MDGCMDEGGRTQARKGQDRPGDGGIVCGAGRTEVKLPSCLPTYLPSSNRYCFMRW